MHKQSPEVELKHKPRFHLPEAKELNGSGFQSVQNTSASWLKRQHPDCLDALLTFLPALNQRFRTILKYWDQKAHACNQAMYTSNLFVSGVPAGKANSANQHESSKQWSNEQHTVL